MELKNKKITLMELVFISMAGIYPMAWVIANSGAAVTYAGFAAPLVPIIGGIFILLVTVPILEYTRFTKFAGGYYGLAELGFGKAAGKFVALENVAYYIVMMLVNANAIPFFLSSALYYMAGYLLPIYVYILLAVLLDIIAFFVTIYNLKLVSKFIIGAVSLEIIIAVIVSAVSILRTPYNSVAAFSFSSLPSGTAGLFLGVAVAGFLYYTTYGTNLFFSEEVSKHTDIWKSIVLSVSLMTILGIFVIYAEVAGIGPTSVNSIPSDWNPGVIAFTPYIGHTVVVLMVGVALFGAALPTLLVGLGGSRVLYSMGRDRFFSKKTNEFLTRLNPKYDTPQSSALLILFITLVLIVVEDLLLIHFYGTFLGYVYGFLFPASIGTALWFIHHAIPQFSMQGVYRKQLKQSLKKPRNLIIGVAAPIFGSGLFIYSFYEGYSSLPEPYFAGLILVFAVTIASIVIIAVKYKNKSLGESFISEEILRNFEGEEH
ncbi:MAG: APC family permease [Thermoplasmatales archaeon]